MPDRMSDAEVLGQTAEWLSRLADTIERATTGLADSIAQVRAEQGELRDEIVALSGRVAEQDGELLRHGKAISVIADSLRNR